MSGVSRKELDELKVWIGESVKKRLGFNEKSVVKAALDCVSKNLDKRSSIEQLATFLDDLAPQFVEDLFNRVTQIKTNKLLSSHKSSSSRKRTLEDVFGDDTDESSTTAVKSSKRKQSRFDALKEDNEPLPPAIPEPMDGPAHLNSSQISEMVANMKKQIEERKRQLQVTGQARGIIPSAAPVIPQSLPTLPHTTPSLEQQQQLMNDAIEKAKRAAELQKKIQEQLASKPNLFANSQLTHAGASLVKSGMVNLTSVKDEKPSPLILDDKGRTVDEHGKAVQLSSRMPTLKANIRAKKREQFKVEKPSEDLTERSFFDSRVAVPNAVRAKRTFKFHDKGKFQEIAQRIRAKTQLEKLQKQIAAVAKKTGISSATKLAMIAPTKDIQEGHVPDIEWWDRVIVQQGRYEDVSNAEQLQGITALIEHPKQKHPPAEPKEALVIPIMLTKKERKKIRTQRRREVEKEKTEKIRLGLEPPPPPKVKISNLMRVLGSEAVQDPTKVEAHVRAQMAQRQKAHEAANAARKLTPEARREKNIKKLKEDTSLGVHVAVFRVNDLHSQQKKYKVDINAQQYYLKGCVVLYRELNLVIAEGGPKAIKKYKRLMLHRIKWAEEKKKKREDDDEEKKVNACVLVWEGTNKEHSFNDWKFKQCPTEAIAREHLKKYGVEHYWDLARRESLLEGTEET
ncbi:U4/U6 small nuclear ribonucleoprotein Prp3-like [Actinia tenebrosa]|uniref:U4/U6 small nuclear ribonucleoprotein Prp3 n=1 Tax=Actinia tenebrosa TaxID=6105 RepID=A0A6P8IVA2_ACTTE|nr:U4/U6 small nuclear ribonucleoprotein Prp3-like [Actinia tenebrosa]